MLTRHAITAVVGGIALLGAVGVMGGTAMVRRAPPPGAAAPGPEAQFGLYPDGTALRRVGAQMILR